MKNKVEVLDPLNDKCCNDPGESCSLRDFLFVSENKNPRGQVVRSGFRYLPLSRSDCTFSIQRGPDLPVLSKSGRSFITETIHRYCMGRAFTAVLRSRILLDLGLDLVLHGARIWTAVLYRTSIMRAPA